MKKNYIVYAMCSIALLFLSITEGFSAPVISVPSDIEDGVPFFVRINDTAPFTAIITWRDKQHTIQPLKKGTQYQAVAMLVLPVDTPAGTKSLAVTIAGSKKNYSLKSIKRTYRTQHLNVAQSYVVPPQSEMAKINKDIAERKVVFGTVTPLRQWDEKTWVRPAEGLLTSPFGARRVFNGQPRNPHNALDFKAGTGEPIVATAGGRVIFAGPQYYSGNIVYIDHGQGVITGYAHLSKFLVKKGDTVKAGQRIGEAGATGRVTGPHLHFTMHAYGVAVDPTILVAPEGR